MVHVFFKFVNSGDEFVKSMLYISPAVVPTSSDGSIVVGNGVSVTIGGANKTPTVDLFPALYNVRVAGFNFNTQFQLELSGVADGTTVSASAYMVQ